MQKSKSVVITGVSSGIGAAAAKVLAKNGLHVFGSVRKQADADKLSAELGDGFTPLLFDVTDINSIKQGAETVSKALEGRTLAGLVNNAGIAFGAPLLYQPLEEFKAHLDVNIMGVVAATQAFGPLLGVDQEREGAPGRIINIGSIGGRHAFPYMAAYHTTKFGLEGLTESLRRELLPFGIDAILVAPGSVATDIWEKATKADHSRYKDTPYGSLMDKMVDAVSDTGSAGLPAERIGETIFEALTAKNPKTYYRTTHSELEFQALTKLPKRWVDRLIGKRLGLLK